MHISGIRHAYFNVLIGNAEWSEQETEYDEAFKKEMFNKCKEFWNNFQKGIPVVHPHKAAIGTACIPSPKESVCSPEYKTIPV